MSGSAQATAIEIESDSDDLGTTTRKLPFTSSPDRYHSIANDIFGPPPQASSSTPKSSKKRESPDDWTDERADTATVKKLKRSSIKREDTPSRTVESATTSIKKETTKRGPKRGKKNEEIVLPYYLVKRREKWDEKTTPRALEEIPRPPDYDDLEFTEDEYEDDVKLEKKPQLSHIKPCRDYEHYELDTGGIIPAPIAQYLRDYQIEGVKRLHEAFILQRGFILGDDMGLGKTIQIIAFLTAAFGKTADKRDAKRMRKMRREKPDTWYPRILLVVPSSLIMNWLSELERWGYWEVYKCHGDEAKHALQAARAGYAEIMITSYHTYAAKQDEINAIEWDCVVADECHNIKEPMSITTQAMRNINAICRIGLTGTPIQNKYEELWTVLDWITVSRIGTLSQWNSAYFNKLRVGQRHEATSAEVNEKRRVQMKLYEKLLPPYFLRRMKSMIADQLPKKTDRIIFCPLTEEQKTAYDNICNDELVQAIRVSGMACDCGSNKARGYCCYAVVAEIAWKECVFPAMHLLKRLSSHLALISPASGPNDGKSERDMYFLRKALPETAETMYVQRNSVKHWINPTMSGKWQVLKKMLEVWYAQADKVLIFAHNVRFLKMVDEMLQMQCNYPTSYIDGSMNLVDRQRAIDEFNSDPKQFVFLISTRAGGTGLNLTAANIVCVLDPSWNPANDLQAQDRAYRIGQQRDVEVYRFIAAGTIEESIYARQIYKQQQTALALGPEVQRRYFSGMQASVDQQGDIFGLSNLFAPTNERVPWSEILNKTNIAETRTGNLIVGLDMEAAAAEDEPTEDADEDKFMSELAKSILDPNSQKRKKAAETAAKKNAISAILENSGVKNSHEHAQVLKSSKIEQQISARASKVGTDYGLNRELAFAEEGGGISYQYNPSEEVRIRQFCSMAKWKGYEDVSEFALTVEGWTSGQRQQFLDGWYRYRREALEKSESEED